MVFFFLFGCFLLGVGLNCSFLIKGLGCLGGRLNLGWALFFWIRLRAVDGASIFVMPNASQKVPISSRNCAFSDPYLDWIFISLQRFNPSVLMIPKICPNVSKLKGMSLVPKF